MFQFASGIEVPFPDKIKEEFEKCENAIFFHISFEKIRPLLADFLRHIDEPVFLAIHLPLTEQEEKEIRDPDGYPHDEILYLDGCSRAEMAEILSKYGEVMLHDGPSQFAIASHTSKDEIFIQKYKIICIYSKQIDNYAELMKKYGITQTKTLVTAWDTFSEENPGACSSVTIDGKYMYDVVEELKQKGMYRAKIVKG